MPLPHRRQRLIFEALEPRVLLAADALSALAVSSGAGSALDSATHEQERGHGLGPQAVVTQSVKPGAQAGPTGEASHREAAQPLELVVIDAAIDAADRAALLADLQQHVAQGRAMQLVQLDGQRDPVAQISLALAAQTEPVSALHLISHGDAQGLQLGGLRLDSSSVAAYRDSLQAWQPMLAPDADLLLYGCDLAASDQGLALMRQLAAWTGADVAASDDATGAAADGADWDFEVVLGDVSTPLVVSQAVQAQWLEPLAVLPQVSPGPQIVNTTTAGEQSLRSESRGSQRAVAVAENGTGMVVWTEGDAASANQVWGRRTNADGSFNGAAFRIDDGSFTVNEHVSVAMVPGTNGRKFVAIWEVNDLVSRDDAGVRGRVWDFNLSAANQAGLFRVNANGNGSQRNPSFAMADDGTFVVAWETVNDSSGNGVYARRFNADGSPINQDFVVASNATGATYTNPTVARAGSTGAFAIAYDRAGTTTRLELNVYNAAGTKTNSTPIVVSSYTGTDGLGFEPAMVARADGSYVIGWTTAVHDQVMRAVYSSTGTVLQAAQGVWGGGNRDRLHSVSVAAAPSNDYVLTFSQTFDDGSSDIYAQVYTAAGVQAENFTLNQGGTSGNQRNPSIAMPDRDMVIGVWDGAGTGDSQGVYLARMGSMVDAPVINAPGALTGGAYVASLSEGATSGALWQFSTAPSMGVSTTISWSLVSGLNDDRTRFSIGASTGRLVLNVDSDFENPMDLGGDNRYSVTLRATDNWGNTTDLPVQVRITDVSSQAWVDTAADTVDAGIVAGNPLHTIEWLNLVGRQAGDGKISLREAVIAANNAASTVTAANNRIAFNLPDGADADTLPDAIRLSSALPQLSRPVQIDGLLALPTGASLLTTNLASPDSDSVYQAPRVVLDSPVVNGTTSGVFELLPQASDSLIRGVSIRNLDGIGVYAYGADRVDLRSNEFVDVAVPIVINDGVYIDAATGNQARNLDYVSTQVSARLNRIDGLDSPLIDHADGDRLGSYVVNDGAWNDGRANRGMDSPIIDAATRLSANSVRVQGHVGLSTGNTVDYAGAVIDIYRLLYDASWTIVTVDWLGTTTAGPGGGFDAAVPWDDTPGELQMLSVVATLDRQTSEFADEIWVVQTAPLISVTAPAEPQVSGAENEALALPPITLSDVNVDPAALPGDAASLITLTLQARLGDPALAQGQFQVDQTLAAARGVQAQADAAGGLTLRGPINGLLAVWDSVRYRAPDYVHGTGQIEVVARDAQGLSTTLNLGLTVDRVVQRPTFEQATYAVTMLEHQAAVTTVRATDLDAQRLSYSIVGTDSLPDGLLFEINPDTGALRFKPDALPDIDAAADVGGDHVYNLRVQVVDADEASSTADVRVEVRANILWVTRTDDTERDGAATMTAAQLVTASAADGLGITLREALLAANNTPGLDRIYFDLPGEALQTVAVADQALPAISSPVIIDGTQGRTLVDGFWLPQLRAGMVGGLDQVATAAPIVAINGGWTQPGAPSPVDDGLGRHGLSLDAGSDGSTVRGLIVQGFDGSGLLLRSGDNLIAGNTVTGNRLNGVRISAGVAAGAAASGNRVLSNALSGNGLLGLDLYTGQAGINDNDDALTPSAPNLLIDHPVIGSNRLYRDAAGRLKLDVAGWIGLNGASNRFAGARIEFFAVDAADTDLHGEGRWLLGAITLDADATDSRFSGTLDLAIDGMQLPAWASTTRLTATATLPTVGTSEFAANVLVRTAPVIAALGPYQAQEDVAALTLSGVQISDLAQDLDQVVITVDQGELLLPDVPAPLLVTSQAQGAGWRLTVAAPEPRSLPDATYHELITTALGRLSYRPASNAYGTYTLQVQARDVNGEAATPVTGTITIAAANDAAQIVLADRQPTMPLQQMETVRDVLTLAWRDQDQRDPGFAAPTWGVLPSADSARFEIDPTSGVLRFKSDAIPDFEAWVAAGSQPYQVTVGLFDAGATALDQPSDTQTFAISLLNADNTLVIRSTDDGVQRAEGIQANNPLHTVEWLNARYRTSITLREALIAANNTAGADSIGVDFSGLAPGSTPVIRLSQALPVITDRLTLDGRHPVNPTQPAVTERLLIDGSAINAATPVDGLTLGADTSRGRSSAFSTVRGLGLAGFSGYGLRVTTDSSTIADNLLGATALAGGIAGNASGGLVLADGASDNEVGSTQASAGNLITGNRGDGVLLTGAATRNNTLANNRIEVGVDAGLGLEDGAWGIRLSNGTHGNRIGAMPLDWALIDGPMGNQIVGNNYGGILVEGATRSRLASFDNRISGNTITTRGGLAIDLGDMGLSADTGEGRDGVRDAAQANRGVDRPVLDRANRTLDGALHVRGHVGPAVLSSASAFADAWVDVYVSAGEPGAPGQLLRHLGRAQVNAAGVFELQVDAATAGALNAQSVITAVLIQDMWFGPIWLAGNTSESAPNVSVNLPPAMVFAWPAQRFNEGEPVSFASVGFADPDNNVQTVRLEVAQGRLDLPLAELGWPSDGIEFDPTPQARWLQLTAAGDSAQDQAWLLSRLQAVRWLPDPDFEGPMLLGGSIVDWGGLATPIAQTVERQALPDAPVITGPDLASGEPVTVLQVRESLPITTLLARFTATDADTDAQLRWTLPANRGDNARFVMDELTGALRLAAPVDAEAFAAGAARQYSAVVQVRDQTGLTAERTLTVLIADVDDEPLIVLGDQDAAADAVSELAQAGASVGIRLLAQDRDVTAQISYELTDNADGRFWIDAQGVVRLTQDGVGRLDFEDPTQNGFSLIARIRSGERFEDRPLRVTVVDDNEHRVAGLRDSDGRSNQWLEGSPQGSAVGITALATDADGSNNTVSYRLTVNPQAIFAIDERTGVVTVARPELLDFEQGTTSYQIEVSAHSTDGSTQSMRFDIALMDRYEPPAARAVDLTLDGREDQAQQIDIVAMLAQSGITNIGLTADVSAQSGSVQVDSQGRLVYTPAPDFHGVDTVSYTVQTPQGSRASAQLTIRVASVNDLPVAQTPPRASVRAGEMLTLAASYFPMRDLEGDPLQLEVASLPTLGQLFLNGVPVTVGQRVPVSVLQAGPLVYLAPNGLFDRAFSSFSYRAGDATEAGLAFAAQTQTLSLELLPGLGGDMVGMAGGIAAGFGASGGSDANANASAQVGGATASLSGQAGSSGGAANQRPGSASAGSRDADTNTQAPLNPIVSSAPSAGHGTGPSNKGRGPVQADTGETVLNSATVSASGPIETPHFQITSVAAELSIGRLLAASGQGKQAGQGAQGADGQPAWVDGVHINLNLLNTQLQGALSQSQLWAPSKFEAQKTETQNNRSSSGVSFRSETNYRQFDQLRQQVSEKAASTRINSVVSSVAVSGGMSVGYVIWLLRGGVLASTMLSSLPAWRTIDPLPVLSRSGSLDGDDDGDSLESLVSTDGDDGDQPEQDRDDAGTPQQPMPWMTPALAGASHAVGRAH